MSFEVLLYNVPKVDGEKVTPVAGNRTESFEDLESAKKFAADHKDKFDRVVLMGEESGEGEEGEEKRTRKMVERYTDGRREEAAEIVRR